MSIAKRAYLDMKYYPDTPLGQSWAGYINTRTAYTWDPEQYLSAKHLLGVEAPLWTEFIETIDDIEYMTFPRILAYAEIGWTPKYGRDWNDFKRRAGMQSELLEQMNVNYFRDPVVWDE